MSELISIVTTLYNYARFVGDLAQSVVRQSYRDWEWIIVDDASTDNPLEVLHSYIRLARVVYIRLPKNQGYSNAKNVGIRNSHGEHIVMIDADDMLTPKSLELRYKALKNSDKLWIHGEVQVLNSDGTLSEDSREWKRNFRRKLIKDGTDLTKTYHHRLIHAQSVMVRRELHKKIGLYDPKLRFSSDNEMWRRIIGFGHVPEHIEDFVAIYRVHPDRMARSPYKRKHGLRVKAQLVEDVQRRIEKGIEKELLW